MTTDFAAAWLADGLDTFAAQKQLAERAMAQAGDATYFARPAEPGNSIAIIVKHLAGNLRSRWTDFLVSDGEKPDRDREGEFRLTPEDTRESLTARWEAGWQTLFDALSPLGPDDLLRTVLIRGEPHTVLQAVNRQLSHYAYHVGQIVLLARVGEGDGWRWLSIAPGASAAYNAAMAAGRP